MTDTELLEAAAKAAGVELIDRAMGSKGYIIDGAKYWNPLTDDADALRLAVKCGIRIDLHPRWVYARAVGPNLPSWMEITQGWGNGCYPHDAYEATRRAITRAAAAMTPKAAP